MTSDIFIKIKISLKHYDSNWAFLRESAIIKDKTNKTSIITIYSVILSQAISNTICIY